MGGNILLFDKKYWPDTVHGRWIEDNGILDLVSVIVPTYNREVYILETLESVFSQTYRPIELIIVDDGSTDATVELVSKWFEKYQCDDFICKYFCQDNQGAPVARNRGVIESKGEFLQFLDSDDWLDKSKVAIQVNTLLYQQDVDVAIGKTFIADQGNILPYKPSRPDGLVSVDQLVNFQSVPGFGTRSPLFRRRVLCQIGPWFEELECCQDTEYGNRLFSSGANLCYTPLAKSYYRQGHNPTGRVGYEHADDKIVRYARNSLRRLSLFWKYLPSHEKERKELREQFSEAFYIHLLSLKDNFDLDVVSRSVKVWEEVAPCTSFATTERQVHWFTSILGMRTGFWLFFIFRGIYHKLSQPSGN